MLSSVQDIENAQAFFEDLIDDDIHTEVAE